MFIYQAQRQRLSFIYSLLCIDMEASQLVLSKEPGLFVVKIQCGAHRQQKVSFWSSCCRLAAAVLRSPGDRDRGEAALSAHSLPCGKLLAGSSGKATPWAGYAVWSPVPPGPHAAPTLPLHFLPSPICTDVSDFWPPWYTEGEVSAPTAHLSSSWPQDNQPICNMND